MRHPTEDLTALIDRALSPERAAEVERHLSSCAECRGERDRLLGGLAALAALPPSPAPSPLFEVRVAARLAAERRRAPGLLARIFDLRWRLAAPAAATAVAITIGVFSVRHERARERAAAENLELLLDFEVVASLGDVNGPEDAAVVEHLDEIAAKDGRP